MCDMRGARPSGREVLIELMTDSAVFLIGRESINGSKETVRNGTVATKYLCAVGAMLMPLHPVMRSERQSDRPHI
jgi:hypothetical protein